MAANGFLAKQRRSVSKSEPRAARSTAGRGEWSTRPAEQRGAVGSTPRPSTVHATPRGGDGASLAVRIGLKRPAS